MKFVVKSKKTYPKKKAAKNQLATKSYVKNVLKRTIETKIYDVISYVSPTTAGIITDLSTISQGVTAKDRVGDVIAPMYLDIRYVITDADTTQLFRVMIFKWHADDASDAPQLNELLQDTAGYGCISPLKWEDKERFTVLYDKRIVIRLPSVIQEGHSKRIKISGKTNYNGSSTTGSGHIYALFLSDSGVAPHPSILFYGRLYYKDA